MAESKKKKKNSDAASETAGKKNKGKLAVRIGAALLLLAVVAGVVLPLYSPGSPIKSGKTVMTVNSHDISADEFEYFLSNEILSYVYSNGGSTFADSANMNDLLDYIVNEISFYYVFQDWAEETGNGITEEQKEEIRTRLNESKDGFETEEEYQEYLDGMYVTEDVLYSTECLFECLNNYYNYLTDPEEGPYAASAENLADDPETFDIYGAKHILFLFDSEDRTDEETKALAEDVLARIKLGEDFDELMNEYTEDPGIAVYPDGYTFTTGEMVDEFYNGTVALEVGEVSDLVESAYGYHIIKRVEPERNEVVKKIVMILYETEIDSRVAAATVSTAKGFDQIKYTDFQIGKDYPPDADSTPVDDSGEETATE